MITGSDPPRVVINHDMQTLRLNTRDASSRSFKQGHLTPVESMPPPVATHNKASPSDRPNTSRQEFEFINITGPPSERNPESQYKVRSNAMHSFILKKNRYRRAGLIPDPRIEQVNIDELKGRFKLATRSRMKRKKPTTVSLTLEKTIERIVKSSQFDRWDHEKQGLTVCRSLFLGTKY